MHVLEIKIYKIRKKTFRPSISNIGVGVGVGAFNLVFAEKRRTVGENHDTKE